MQYSLLLNFRPKTYVALGSVSQEIFPRSHRADVLGQCHCLVLLPLCGGQVGVGGS
jgi:hypothetical protein